MVREMENLKSDVLAVPPYAEHQLLKEREKRTKQSGEKAKVKDS